MHRPATASNQATSLSRNSAVTMLWGQGWPQWCPKVFHGRPATICCPGQLDAAGSALQASASAAVWPRRTRPSLIPFGLPFVRASCAPLMPRSACRSLPVLMRASWRHRCWLCVYVLPVAHFEQSGVELGRNLPSAIATRPRRCEGASTERVATAPAIASEPKQRQRLKGPGLWSICKGRRSYSGQRSVRDQGEGTRRRIPTAAARRARPSTRDTRPTRCASSSCPASVTYVEPPCGSLNVRPRTP
jgi:hypothetical protein